MAASQLIVARKSIPPAEPPRLAVARSQVAADLDERIVAGEALQARPIDSPADLKAVKADYYTWDDFNRRLLKSRFTSAEVEQEYSGTFFGFGGSSSFEREVSLFHDDLSRHIRKLRSIKDQLGLYEESGARPAPTVAAAANRTTIFVVHGHDEQRRLELTAFLRQVSAAPVVVLHEKANLGRTVIEKFEDNAGRAAYAVVLLTGDDEGRPVGNSELRRRARQNVVFELGFFNGALGRSHVTVLYEDGVELPSDMGGVLYVPLDTPGAWKLKLAKELKHAQIDVDLNKAV